MGFEILAYLILLWEIVKSFWIVGVVVVVAAVGARVLYKTWKETR